jgi:hypothetical protein
LAQGSAWLTEIWPPLAKLVSEAEQAGAENDDFHGKCSEDS